MYEYSAFFNFKSSKEPYLKRTKPSIELINESLAKNMVEFVLDLEKLITFECWFKRYEDIFVLDCWKLDDASRVRRLLRKPKFLQSWEVHKPYYAKTSQRYWFWRTITLTKKILGKQSPILATNVYSWISLDLDDFLTCLHNKQRFFLGWNTLNMPIWWHCCYLK